MEEILQSPRSWGGLLASCGGKLTGTWWGRVIIALFLLGETYRASIGPVWQQATSVQENYAKYLNQKAEAAASEQKMREEAQRLAEEVKLKKAEADVAPQKAAADAVLMENEAAKKQADARAAIAITEPKIAAARAKAAADQQRAVTFLGLPLPDTLQFNSTK